MTAELLTDVPYSGSVDGPFEQLRAGELCATHIGERVEIGGYAGFLHGVSHTTVETTVWLVSRMPSEGQWPVQLRLDVNPQSFVNQFVD